MSYPLGKIGYDYGRCKTETIVGDIKWFAIEYTQIYGVQKVSFEDEAQTWTFGFEIEGQAKRVQRTEFGPDKVWAGVHGIESNDGIIKLGIITMNPQCIPEGWEKGIQGEGADGTADSNGEGTNGEE